MKKALFLSLGLLAAAPVVALDDSIETVTHVVHIAGLSDNEGRYIRVDMVDETQFKSGYYFCASAGDLAYAAKYSAKTNKTPVHSEHVITFSICQNESLAQCQEFATDQYLTFRNQEGHLQNDSSEATIDVSAMKENFAACQPNFPKEMDNLVRQSIHASDRRFSGAG